MSSRLRHLATLVSELGVSARCFKKPRAIDMTIATWTTDLDAVTCPKCKKAMR